MTWLWFWLTFLLGGVCGICMTLLIIWVGTGVAMEDFIAMRKYWRDNE